MFDKLCKALRDVIPPQDSTPLHIVLQPPHKSSNLRQEMAAHRTLDRSLTAIMASHRERWNYSPYGESNIKVQTVSKSAFDALRRVRNAITIQNTACIFSIPKSQRSPERVHYVFVNREKVLTAHAALARAIEIISDEGYKGES